MKVLFIDVQDCIYVVMCYVLCLSSFFFPHFYLFFFSLFVLLFHFFSSFFFSFSSFFLSLFSISFYDHFTFFFPSYFSLLSHLFFSLFSSLFLSPVSGHIPIPVENTVFEGLKVVKVALGGDAGVCVGSIYVCIYRQIQICVSVCACRILYLRG